MATTGKAANTPPAAQSTAAARGRFRPDIQGLRAVAVVLVVIYHADLGLPGGYVGVDVFFVISGFLITSQLVDELASRRRISLLSFYARRVRRILPAATVTIVTTVIVARLVLDPIAAQRVFEDAMTSVFYGANFRFAIVGANYLNSTLPPSPIQHFWSLAVEEQFYLVWPVILIGSSLVWLGRNRQRPRHQGAGHVGEDNEHGRAAPDFALVAGVLVVLATVSFFVGAHETVSSPTWAYYSIFSRAWELAAGALAALARPYAARLWPPLASALTWAGLVAILVAAVNFNSQTAFPGTAALVPVGGAVAVVVGGTVLGNRSGAGVLLGTAPAQWLGALSYSLYLWHWPVLVLAPNILGHALSTGQTLVALALGLALAVASYRLVEQPFRRASVLARRPRLALSAALPLAGMSLAAVAVSTFTLPAAAATGAPVHLKAAKTGDLNLAGLEKDLQAAEGRQTVPANLAPALSVAPDADAKVVLDGCSLQHDGTRSKPCFFGDLKSKTTVALLGDSHAAMWFPALDLIAEQQHWRLVDLTKSACPPVEVKLGWYPQCDTWKANAMAQLAALHPVLVVVSWARLEEPGAKATPSSPSTAQAWSAGVSRLFSFLSENSGKALFISDVPTMEQDAPDCISGNLSSSQACATPRGKAVPLPTVKRDEITAAAAQGAAVLDPTQWFCTASTCPVIVGNILMYRDNGHITPQYSRFLAPLLAKVVEPLVAKAALG
jgi:peptidoglycan/LPS O-acetylase OafA/YrhL